MAGVELSDRDKKQLITWIGGKYKFELLYKISRDGCTSTAFHNLCNNKGPTVTVLYNTNNTVYGGYTAISWHSKSAYTQDNNAFLFRLTYNGKFQPMRYPVQTPGNAIYGKDEYGPTFGGGHELRCFVNTVNLDGTQFPLNGSFSFTAGFYDARGHTDSDFANSSLKVYDLEVYAVIELPYNTPLDTPWRKTKEWNTRLMQELKESVELYQPRKELKVPQAKILLIGQVGAGKSSFFNTMNSIFHGFVTSQACSGSAEHSLTTVYRMYQVRNGENGKPLNFRLCDTQGLEEDQGIDGREICYLLDGNIPDGYQFNRTDAPDIKSYVQSPTISDKIHCVAFVVDASSFEVMPEKVLERIKDMQTKMNERGIPQVVLLTKIDKICELTTEDVSMVFKSPAVRDMVDKVYQIMGLPRAHILPLKNYESEMELDESVSILALLNLQQILRFANNYLCNILDQIETNTQQGMNINAAKFVTVTSTVTSAMLKEPWRIFTQWNTKTLERLKESAQDYKPYDQRGIPETRLLLIGQVGAGKSSFINTINSIFLGRLSNTTENESDWETSATLFSVCEMQNASNGQMNFRFCDTPGLERDQMEVDEFAFMLDGNVPDGYQYNPTVRFSSDAPDFIRNPKLHERMHCVVYVIDASTIDVMPENIQQKIKDLQSKVYQRGICQVVLLTKIDKICPLVSDDISKVFYSSGIRDAVDNVSQKIEMPKPCILPVKNYEIEVELDDNISILALHSLNQILNYANEYNGCR